VFACSSNLNFCVGAQGMNRAARNNQQVGVSLLETMVALSILSVLLAIAAPLSRTVSQMFAVSGDTRSLSVSLNLARMRAAADFTHGRLYADLKANTFHVEFWNKTKSCWRTYDDIAANTCTQTTSPVTSLTSGDTFGFGSLSQGPTAATSSIAQPPACTSGVAGTSPGSAIANTACIEFNSRGFPVDSAGKVLASDAIYMQSGSHSMFSAITVPVAGQPTAYSYSGSGSTWNLY
jgi:prepilin-type N-terminal cleavage/methylation domain-containing protein